MAEIILATLCIFAGGLSACAAYLVLLANAIGAVDNPDAFDIWPALVLAILALAGIAGGISMLVF